MPRQHRAVLVSRPPTRQTLKHNQLWPWRQRNFAVSGYYLFNVKAGQGALTRHVSFSHWYAICKGPYARFICHQRKKRGNLKEMREDGIVTTARTIVETHI